MDKRNYWLIIMLMIKDVSEDAISSDELQSIAKMIADAVAGKKPLEMLTPEKARLFDKNSSSFLSPKSRELKKIEDRMIAGTDCDMAIRIYQPHSDKSELPGLVFFHGGDSAGGNLATVICLKCRDEKLSPPASQLLLYPVTDAFSETNSKKDYADGLLLTSSAMNWFHGHYLESSEQAKNPYVYPLRAKNLVGLPLALVITAGFDPLRDEGLAYGNRLGAAGVNVTHSCYTSMIHGFMFFAGGIPQRGEDIKESARFLERTLS